MSNVRYCYPRFKVFVYGVDVSKDVLSVNATQHDGAAPNTCQITLANEFDKYIMTTEDMVAVNKLKFDNGVVDIPWLGGSSVNRANIEQRGELLKVDGSIPSRLIISKRADT